MQNRYEVREEVVAIFLDRKDGSVLEALVDLADLPKLLSFNVKWYAHYDKKLGSYYVHANKPTVGGKRGTIPLHRFLFDDPDGYVDHKSHNTLDNRRSSNLRVLSMSGNRQNMKKAPSNTTTDVLGVSFCPSREGRKKYAAQVRVDGKFVLRKYFTTQEEAEQAVLAARARHMPFSKEGGDTHG